ncbi:hypothetical protein B5E53_18410 [Eubacterium sp. An11]|uniref:hypothetical protein n=1 Tax=Eubacterium sp. An11 TaxID=1965542 RepID=UPI000B372822|nr:hypothetical protein [Eubacterium sp. An11]OUQ62023.1 hypothetical protein B5E53_18410 [Eubacterium sp. An11]
MNFQIFYSDIAIICYELIIIITESFFVRKFFKEEKQNKLLEMERNLQKRDEILDRKLTNDKRR